MDLFIGALTRSYHLVNRCLFPPMGHEPVLIPDETLWIQLGLFLFCYLVLRFFVFGPYLALLAARRAATVGLREKVLETGGASEKLRATYEERLREHKKGLAEWAEAKRKSMHDEHEQIVSRAREAAQSSQQRAMAELEKEESAARTQLQASVPDLAAKISGKVLGGSFEPGLFASKETRTARQQETVFS